MDHLPRIRPPGLLSQELTFPLRCDPNGYDGGPLETFPERRGFRLNYWSNEKFSNQLRTKDGAKPDVRQSTALLQEWLYFGLLSVLHSVYGTSFDGYDYVKICDGARVLSLAQLPHHVITWRDLEGIRPKTERREHFREIERHAMRALLFLTNNFTPHDHGSINPNGTLAHVVCEESRTVVEDGLEIMLLVLVEAIECITRTIYFPEGKHWVTSGSGSLSFAVVNWTNNLHWCPSEINLMKLTFDHSTFCFANRIYRKNAKTQHPQCTASKCLAFDLEVSNYQTSHTENCDGCGFLCINPNQLGILSSREYDTVPRVKISGTSQHDVEVSLTDSEQYVAISHVWSDGLGHPPGINALPRCQVWRLRNLVLQTGLDEANVWIDSLCVPAVNGPAKRAALSRMADVYRNATTVLVIDSDLLTIPSSSCNEELLLRIALCKWMRRLWTLEEGVVARLKLRFQFSDKSITLPEPHKPPTDRVASNCAALIAQYLPLEADMLSVITSLHFRSTSWPADEPLCIGYIMGIDVTSIVNVDDEHERMRQLYRLLSQKQSKFPWQFLFTDEDKMTTQPFRWAPSSLLNLKPHDVFYLQGVEGDGKIDAIQTDRGLKFQCQNSCLLSFSSGENIRNCMVLRIDALSYVLCPVPRGGPCRDHARFWEPGPDLERCLTADPKQDWTTTWQAQHGFRPEGNWGLICSARGGGYGVMVAIDELKDKVLYASFIGQVHIYELRTKYTSILSVNKEFWGQVGVPELDAVKVQQEQERVERELLGRKEYSSVDCVMRFGEDVTWCIG